MAKIISVLNSGGAKEARVGAVKVNSFNVSPDTIIADASPATISAGDLNLYDYFLIDQDDADTDEFDLPSAAEIGDVITLFAVDVFELRTELDADKINNVADKGYQTTVGDVLTCTKVASDNWMVTSLTILGAAVTVVAAIAV